MTTPLRDRGPGGRRAAVGVKAAPGPLYGVRADSWQALACVLAVLLGAETIEGRRARLAREGAA